MKKFEYKFKYNSITRDTILNDKYLLTKQEKDILDLTLQGYSIKEISNELSYSESTIQRRRKSIYEKTLQYMIEDDDEDDSIEENIYCVYILIFPNNKVYIGQTLDTQKRWNNGNGYKSNKNMYEDIQKYGWNNITKRIVYDNLTYEQSLEKEKELIIHYKSNLPEYGYNTMF